MLLQRTAPSPDLQGALDQRVTEGTRDPEEKRVHVHRADETQRIFFDVIKNIKTEIFLCSCLQVTPGTQVWRDYPGPTLSKFHTGCRKGMQVTEG